MTCRDGSDWPEKDRHTPDERSGLERRTGERRAQRNNFDPMFAATLVNHIAKAEIPGARAYAKPKPRGRKGFLVNVKA
jgi:hypothetical protein